MFIIDAVREPAGNYYKWSTDSTINNSDPSWLQGEPSLLAGEAVSVPEII